MGTAGAFGVAVVLAGALVAYERARLRAAELRPRRTASVDAILCVLGRAKPQRAAFPLAAVPFRSRIVPPRRT